MFILLTILLFFIKYLFIAAAGLLLYVDLEITKDISSNIYSVYLAFGCIAFFSLVFFLLGKRILWLIVFLVCGSLYLGMFTQNSEIVEAHQNSILNNQNFDDTVSSAQSIYKIWKMFH